MTQRQFINYIAYTGSKECMVIMLDLQEFGMKRSWSTLSCQQTYGVSQNF